MALEVAHVVCNRVANPRSSALLVPWRKSLPLTLSSIALAERIREERIREYAFRGASHFQWRAALAD